MGMQIHLKEPGAWNQSGGPTVLTQTCKRKFWWFDYLGSLVSPFNRSTLNVSQENKHRVTIPCKWSFDFMKSGGFHVKSIQNLIKANVSTKTIQFDECRRVAMNQDFMKSWVIAPSLHPPTVADPGFPVGWGRGPCRRGCGLPRWLPFENFVCQNKRIGTLRGGTHWACPPRSANAPNWRVFVETSDFIRFWVDFRWNPPDFMNVSFWVISKYRSFFQKTNKRKTVQF